MRTIKLRIDDELAARLDSIAAERFEGNLSMAVRGLIRAGFLGEQVLPGVGETLERGEMAAKRLAVLPATANTPESQRASRPPQRSEAAQARFDRMQKAKGL